jgi:hypothetical protein
MWAHSACIAHNSYLAPHSEFMSNVGAFRVHRSQRWVLGDCCERCWWSARASLTSRTGVSGMAQPQMVSRAIPSNNGVIPCSTMSERSASSLGRASSPEAASTVIWSNRASLVVLRNICGWESTKFTA